MIASVDGCRICGVAKTAIYFTVACGVSCLAQGAFGPRGIGCVFAGAKEGRQDLVHGQIWDLVVLPARVLENLFSDGRLQTQWCRGAAAF